MTKVQVRYELAGPVDEALMEAIARAHGVYGLQWIRLSPQLDSLVVEYDASRLTLDDVDHALRTAGLAVRRVEE
jgi:hypothetical protein